MYLVLIWRGLPALFATTKLQTNLSSKPTLKRTLLLPVFLELITRFQVSARAEFEGMGTKSKSVASIIPRCEIEFEESRNLQFDLWV